MFLEKICVPSIKRNFPKEKTEAAGHSGAAPAGKAKGPEELDTKVELVSLMQVLTVEQAWTQPYVKYLVSKQLLENPSEARHVARRSKAFTIIKGELYKHNLLDVFQRCVTNSDGKSILLDIHEGICGHHAGSRSLVAKALRASFY